MLVKFALHCHDGPFGLGGGGVPLLLASAPPPHWDMGIGRRTGPNEGLGQRSSRGGALMAPSDVGKVRFALP